MHDERLTSRLVDVLEGKHDATGEAVPTARENGLPAALRSEQFPPSGEKGWGPASFPPSGEKGWG
jgi:hypothetical protein